MSKTILVFAALVISITFNAYFIFSGLFKDAEQETYLQSQIKKYPFLSGTILSDFQNDILINFLDLRKTLRRQVDPYGDSFAFYFEYLPTGTSVGVNAQDEFPAASLFKLPVVMAYYHGKERLGQTNNPTATITEDEIDDRFGSLWKKGVGAQISLDDAARIALEDSDNTAAKVVAANISSEDFQSVYQSLDIDLKIASQGAFLSAKNYTSILKALFFTAVLEKDNSQKILSYLTNTKFSDKLPAGLPKNIPFAHKIGVYETGEQTAYMDCGIVYVPRRPYSLCAVSISDEATARKRMAKLSRTVYEYVVKQ